MLIRQTHAYTHMWKDVWVGGGREGFGGGVGGPGETKPTNGHFSSYNTAVDVLCSFLCLTDAMQVCVLWGALR